MPMNAKLSRFVEFTMHRVRMLIHFGVTPYLVFDGDYLPSKAATEDERAKRRAESRKLGLELHRLGKVSQAYLELQKAIDVTPEMARQLIEELKRHNIKYVVAPYEADAQMAYLERKGLIHGVLSEDSDLLVFGVKRLLTKLDQYGECVEINRRDFTACKDISLVGWTDAEFRRMAILSGCDYLPNINKMGLKTAYRLVRKHKTIEKILRMLSFDGVYRVPSGYLEDFRRAELTFLHQRVYCPIRRQVVHATPLEGPEPDNFDFVGKTIDSVTATGIAKGDLHPMTREQIIFYPALHLAASPSPWALRRSNSVNTASDLKPKKPIDEFFKPKRVPLAELDPNSFTPSPSQHRILEQQSGSVLSTPVETPVPDEASASLTGRSNARPSIIRPSTSSSARSLRTQHPPKRQRLCAEEESDGSNACSPKPRQSRFFGAPVVDPSPSLQRRRRAKDATLELWSDDPVEPTIADLPDSASNSREAISRISILRQSSNNTIDPETLTNKGTESATSMTSTMSTETSRTSESETPPCSVPSTASEVTHCSLESIKNLKPAGKMTKAFEQLAKRYSLPSGPPPQATSKALCSSGPAKKTHPSNPIQRTTSRLPRSDLSSNNSVLSQSYDTQIRYPRLPSVFTKKTPSSPTFSILNAAETIPQSPTASSRQSPVRGSEDFIVPCSEAESEGEDDVLEEASCVQPKLNLGRFSFTAQPCS